MLFMLRTHHNEIHRNPRGKSLILQSAQSLGDVQGKKKRKKETQPELKAYMKYQIASTPHPPFHRAGSISQT